MPADDAFELRFALSSEIGGIVSSIEAHQAHFDAAPTVSLLVPEGTRVERLPNGVIRTTSSPEPDPALVQEMVEMLRQDPFLPRSTSEVQLWRYARNLATAREQLEPAPAPSHAEDMPRLAEVVTKMVEHTCYSHETCQPSCPAYAVWLAAQRKPAKEPEVPPVPWWVRLREDE